MQFNGKSAVVVGGAGAIGLELCRQLLKENIDNLAIIDIQDKQSAVLKKLNEEFTAKYIIYIKTNVGQQSQLIESFKHVADKFGNIDIVINTAGIFNDKDVNQTLTVNAGGVMNATILAVNHMSQDNGGMGGIVVNISSIVGLDPIFLMPVYTASKEAIVGFTRAFSHAHYYEKTGVKLITVCPGATLTSFLDDFPEKMIYPDPDAAMKFFNEFPKQSVEDLGKHIMCAIATAKNGSVWTCDNNIMKQVSFNKYWQHS